MKKRVMLLVVSLSIVMLAGGCGSKNDISNYQNTKNTDNAGSADQTTDGTSTDGTSTDGTDASVTVPEKADYKVDDYIKLGQYKGVKVTVDQLTVTDDDVNTAIQDDLKANATNEEVTDRKDVQNGDIVNIDYEGLKDGKAFDGGTATGYDLTIGSGKFIPGFEDKLIGAKVGEKVSIDLTFPADYQQADLAGQAVVFNVTVNSIKKQVIPELTEEYVKSKTSYDTVDAYKEGMRKDLEAKNKQTMEDQKTNNVLTAIIDNSTISSYPQTLLDYYSAQMKNYYTQYASYYGTDFAGFLEASGMTQEDFDKETKSYAEKMASQELVIKSVIEAEKMELTDEEYQKGLTDLAKEYGYTSNDEFLKQAKEEDVKETLLWKKALDFVSAQAVVS